MPRAYDRLIPPVDKDPNRFGTDYANPLEAVSDAAAVAGEQIRDQLVQIIMDKTGIDLSGPIEFIDWLSAQINVTLGNLGTTLLSLAAPIIDKVQEIIDAIRTATGIDLSSPENFLVWLAGLVGIDLRALAKNVQEMIDGLFNLFSSSGAVGKTVGEAVAAIQSWLTGVFQPVADGLAGVVKMIQDLLDGLFGLFGVSGATGKTPLEVITAIGTWLSGVFQPVSDGLAAIGKVIQDLIDGLFGLFGGSGTGTLADMITAATAWMTHWQEFVDGIWTAFSGGVAGVGKTVADALAAVTGWFGGVFQKLLDGSTKLGVIDSRRSALRSNPDHRMWLTSISGIFGIGQSAAASAANANAEHGVQSRRKPQKGRILRRVRTADRPTSLPAADGRKHPPEPTVTAPTATAALEYRSARTDRQAGAELRADIEAAAGAGHAVRCHAWARVEATSHRIGWSIPWRIKVQCNPTDEVMLAVVDRMTTRLEFECRGCCWAMHRARGRGRRSRLTAGIFGNV